MGYLKLSIDNSQAIKKFEAIINHMADMENDFINNRGLLYKNIQENIDNQQNPPGGGTYKNLSEGYKKSVAYAKRQRNSTNPMDTQKYRNNFMLIPMKNGLVVKPLLPYTIYHENPNRNAKGKMPLRSAAWFSNNTIKRLTDNLADSLIRST